MQCTANYSYAHIIIKYHVNIFYCVKTINDYYLFIYLFIYLKKEELAITGKQSNKNIIDELVFTERGVRVRAKQF